MQFSILVTCTTAVKAMMVAQGTGDNVGVTWEKTINKNTRIAIAALFRNIWFERNNNIFLSKSLSLICFCYRINNIIDLRIGWTKEQNTYINQILEKRSKKKT